MRIAKTCSVAMLITFSLGRFAGNLIADEPPAPRTDVAKWYAEDPSRLPKCKVDPRIEKVYPDIHAVLAALKYALANDQGWNGTTWKQDEDLAVVRRGEIAALDDPAMVFGWKADQLPMHMIRKGSPFNDAVTQNGKLADFHMHTFLQGNDEDPIAPRPAAEVMRTLSHELAHVWDCRAHTLTKYSVDAAGAGLPYDFQKLVPEAPFSPEAIRELLRLLGKPEAEKEPESADKHYYIYAVNTSGWSLYVGRPGEVANRAGKSIADGGTGDTAIEAKRLLDKAFDTKEDGLKFLKSKITLGHHSVWTGQFVKYGDTEYRTVHVPEVLKK